MKAFLLSREGDNVKTIPLCISCFGCNLLEMTYFKYKYKCSNYSKAIEGVKDGLCKDGKRQTMQMHILWNRK